MILGNQLLFAKVKENAIIPTKRDEDEMWLPVLGYEGLYEVSNLGNVKSLGRIVVDTIGRVRHCNEKMMSPSEKAKREGSEQGYLEVRLTDDNKKSKSHVVHRLVAEAFIKNHENKPTVNHIDGNKHNNNLDNLEWATYSENNQHAYDNGLKSDNKKIGMYDLNGNLLEVFNSINEAGRLTGYNFRNIHSVCNKTRQTCGGYSWKYMTEGKVGTNQLIFAKTKPDAKIPTKRDCDAGYDIYSCFEEDYLIIPPHTTKLIPTGIASACDEDYYIQLVERGSTGTKGIAQRCGVIDSGFRNEWFCPITNTTSYDLIISKLPQDELEYEVYTHSITPKYTYYPYTKAICQAVVLPVPKMRVTEISLEKLQSIKSERGLGALGSSNK